MRITQCRTASLRSGSWLLLHCPAFIVICVLLSVCLVPSTSAGGAGDWTAYTFANDIRAMAFDRGDIWLATSGGAVRFEPSTEQFFLFTNTDGLSGNDVTGLAVDVNRDVWFGTQSQGLSRRRHDTGEWRTFTPLDGLASERVSTVLIRDNTLWVGTDDGLSVFTWDHDTDEERDTFVFSDAYRASRGVPVGNLNALVISATTIWTGTENGVASVPHSSPNLKDPANWTTYTTTHGLPDKRVNAMAVSGTDVWAGTQNGVAQFDGTRWVPVNSGLFSLEIRDLTFIDGTLWTVTTGEVARFDGTSWVSIGGGVGPSGARTVSGNPTGEVWIGTAGNGLGRLDQGVWRLLPSSGPAGNVVDAIFVDRDHNVWCGFNEGGVSRFDGMVWTSFTTADGLAPGTVSMIGEDPDGPQWFGTFGNGISQLEDNNTALKDDDQWTLFDQTNSVFEGVPEDPLFVVVNAWSLDHDGGQWFSNFGVGALHLSRNGVWTIHRPRAGELSSARIRGIAVGADSSVWFATDSRLSSFHPGRQEWRIFGVSEGLLSPQVNAVVASVTGDVWVGTDAGITRIEAGSVVTSFGLPAGLNTAGVTALAADARGNLWVGSAAGLAVLDPETFEWQVFTEDNSPLADPLVKSLSINTDTGEVWIGTGRGVSRFESGILPARSTLADILVYPNPFIPSRGDVEVVFGQLADGSQVSILTAAGSLVFRIPPERIIAQQVQWDGKNEAGRLVAGGVYFFVVTTPDGSHRAGKIAVIR